jgi:hypothetical protein
MTISRSVGSRFQILDDDVLKSLTGINFMLYAPFLKDTILSHYYQHIVPFSVIPLGYPAQSPGKRPFRGAFKTPPGAFCRFLAAFYKIIAL